MNTSSAETPMPSASSRVQVLRGSEVVQASRVLDWLRTYVSEPHPQLGRAGPVCPFVPVSMRTDNLEFVVHSDVDGSDGGRIRDLLETYRDYFTATVPVSVPLRRRRSLMVVLPNVIPANLHALDEAHAEVKHGMVRNGLMIGQFHAECPDVAVRNPQFRVSIGPVPCFAIRYMAPHDILFLHERPDWFAQYQRRFGDDYRAGRINDPLMLNLYHTAESQLEDR